MKDPIHMNDKIHITIDDDNKTFWIFLPVGVGRDRGVSGVGETLIEAMEDFDKNFKNAIFIN